MATRDLVPKELLASAVPLAEDPGVDAGIAWTRELAQIVIGWAGEAGLAVLGVDVYELREGRLIPQWAMLDVLPRPNETFPEYAQRSVRAVRDYISRYPEPDGADIVYEITVSDRLYRQ